MLADLLIVGFFARWSTQRFGRAARNLGSAACFLCSVVIVPTLVQATPRHLTSVGDIVQLGRQTLEGRISAKITGQVTYVDGLRSVFVQDATGGILVQNPKLEVELKRGQRVEVTGDVTRAQFAPAMTGSTVRILDFHLDIPKPVPAARNDLTDLRMQYRFVELEGVVRSASENQESNARAQLLLLTYGWETTVSIRDAGSDDYRRLEDSVIRVRGVLRARVDGLGVPVLYSLAAQSMDDVSILSPSRPLTRIPLTTVAEIRRNAIAGGTKSAPEHKIRLRGTVGFGGAGFRFVDDTGSLPLLPGPHSDLVPAPQRKEVLAFVAFEEGKPVLQNAQEARAEDNDLTPLPRAQKGTDSGISTVREIRQLSDEDIRRNRSVHIQGTVTYSDQSVRDTFIQDLTGGIFVFAPNGGKLDVHAGQFVALDGIVSVGGFAPVITEPTLRVLGERRLPDPLIMDMERLLTGIADSQFVEARGIVRSAKRESGHLRLEIVWGAHRYLASVAGITEAPAWLLDAHVRLYGVCGAIINFRHQILGIELSVPDITFIHPDGPRDSNDIPMQRIDHLLQYSGTQKSDERARIQGQVTFASPQGPTYLDDFSGAVLIKTHAPISLKVGDWVEAIGTARPGTFGAAMQDAKLTKVASLQAPRPRMATYDSILEGGNDGAFVQIDGHLVNDASGGEQTLLLQAGDDVFEARSVHGWLPALGKGSLIRVTGLTALRVDESAQVLAPVGFSILLRSPEDVVVLKAAPWWTVRRMQNAGFGAAAFVTIAVFWIVVLRRQVAQQTRQLRMVNKDLQRISSQDGLTGIANRRTFDQTLELEFNRAIQENSRLSLIMIDIDYFKGLNDEYGHQRGDECLVKVAAALESVLRRGEGVLARYGGEEFAAILPGMDLEIAREVAERMRVAIRALEFPNKRSPLDQIVSVSAGFATKESTHRMSPAELIRSADQALYCSKSNGRNRITAMNGQRDHDEPEKPPPLTAQLCGTTALPPATNVT